MPIESYEDACNFVRDLLGDNTIPGGDLWTDARLQPWIKSSWDELMLEMANDQVPAAERIVTIVLPAYTAMLVPATFGIKDLKTIRRMEERPAVSRVTVTSCTEAASGEITILATAHGRSNNDKVAVYGVVGVPRANGSFFVTVVDADNLVLRGTEFDGLYVSGGYVMLDTVGGWIDVIDVEQLPERELSDNLQQYEWRDIAFYFVGATTDRQLRLMYQSSNAAPETGDLLVYDGIKNALAYRTAAKIGFSHDRTSEAADWDVEARGARRDGTGGLFYAFTSGLVRQLQRSQLYRCTDPPAHLSELRDE